MAHTFPAPAKTDQMICRTTQIPYSKCQPYYCSAAFPLVPCPSGCGEELCHLHKFLPVNRRGSSIRITSCEALVPIPCITLVLNCCSILAHPNHVRISQLFVPHTAASSCHSDPPPKIFLPPCVKSSPSLLPSTHFQSVFKVYFS